MKKSLGPKTIAYPAPVWVVGTYAQDERANVMTAAWAGICCSKPPCIGVCLRKATHTYGNIMRRKAFTVNVPSEAYAKEVDFFGLVSGRKVDKFSVAKLTAVRSKVVDAPYVEEFPLVLECRVIQVVEIGLHIQFVGEIVDVKADEDVLNQEGMPDVEKVRPILLGPEVLTYHGVGRYLGQAFSLGKELREEKS